MLGRTTQTSSTAALRTSGTLNIRNGTVLANSSSAGTTSTNNIITLTDGTLVVTNTAGTLAKAITTVATTNSTLAFVVSGVALIAVPFAPGIWLVGASLFFYGLANGVISPMQKSLLTQNAPAELRGGIVSVDRLIQQVSKTLSTTIVGIMLVAADLPTIFWLLGILSLLSVVLMAAILRPAPPRQPHKSPRANY